MVRITNELQEFDGKLRGLSINITLLHAIIIIIIITTEEQADLILLKQHSANVFYFRVDGCVITPTHMWTLCLD